jgi:hypothetical protein
MSPLLLWMNLDRKVGEGFSTNESKRHSLCFSYRREEWWETLHGSVVWGWISPCSQGVQWNLLKGVGDISLSYKQPLVHSCIESKQLLKADFFRESHGQPVGRKPQQKEYLAYFFKDSWALEGEDLDPSSMLWILFFCSVSQAQY